MDFRENLQRKLECSFTSTLIAKDTYFIERPNHQLTILYYKNGAKRVIALDPNLEKKALIHIDEDVWHLKSVLLLNRLATLYGQAEKSNARQTVVARIDKKVAMEFQEEHHLQGALPGKYRYGLFKDGDLLAVAVFSGLRNMRHTENYRSIELLHFCQKGQHLVMGGLSKILSTMIRDFSPNDIMTYIDRDWSEGDKFESLGFERKGITDPHCFKVNRNTFERSLYRSIDEPPEEKDHYFVRNLGSVKMVKLITTNI